MSGSPILQNGKLVGAVTHVFVNDPTRGYAIFAEKYVPKRFHPSECLLIGVGLSTSPIFEVKLPERTTFTHIWKKM